MIKLIAIGLLILVAIFFVRRAMSPKPSSTDSATTPVKDGDMVRCDVCGLHVPRAEALIQGKRVYCCPDHAKRGNE